ncbi:MAG: hypothetical protein ABIK20_06945 [Candidatus Omnitrophota bacterium]
MSTDRNTGYLKGQLKQVKGPWSGGEILSDSLISLKGNATAVFTLS